MFDLLYGIVESVWHFVFYLGEYTPKWLGIGMVAVVLSLFILVLLYPIIVMWWCRALFLGVVLFYHQYRCRDQAEFIAKPYRDGRPYVWGLLFIFGLIFSPRSMIGLSNSAISITDLHFSFRGIFPRVTRGQELRDFIANGWEKPDPKHSDEKKL